MRRQDILVLGDSTIDNRAWLGKEKYELGINVLFKQSAPWFARFLIGIIRFFDKLFVKHKPQSVVMHLKEQNSAYRVIDRTNDGFTTKDILVGDYQDKVFSPGAHRYFPHTYFRPLETPHLASANKIVLSIGGNNFREFLLSAQRYKDKINRKAYIKKHYPEVFEELKTEYLQILNTIVDKNPDAQLIIMTQYYPSFVQKMLTGHQLYEFIGEIGESFGLSHDPKEVIAHIVKDTYQSVLKSVVTDARFEKTTISLVDVTSSLNPFDKQNHVGQIEPSGKGGEQIAKMLSYALKHPLAKGDKRIYRFSPAFFKSSDSDSGVFSAVMRRDFFYEPVSPVLMMPKRKSLWSKIKTWLIGKKGTYQHNAQSEKNIWGFVPSYEKTPVKCRSAPAGCLPQYANANTLQHSEYHHPMCAKRARVSRPSFSRLEIPKK
jgi:hypothetical protein